MPEPIAITVILRQAIAEIGIAIVLFDLRVEAPLQTDRAELFVVDFVERALSW
jgi:hypothetical protein